MAKRKSLLDEYDLLGYASGDGIWQLLKIWPSMLAMNSEEPKPLRSVPLSEAKALLNEQRESPLSVAAFARSKGVQPWSLYNARAREQRHALKGTEQRFAEVRVLEPDAALPESSNPIELALPSGVAIRVPRDFDEVALRRLLGVLGPC